MPSVVDYSFARPDPAAIVAAGFTGAIRYLAGTYGTNPKELLPGELAALQAAGLDVGLVWETTATRAGDGSDAGRADGAAANAQADSLGWPTDRPIYYAVDFDASADVVFPYFDGVAAVSSRPWGVYGTYGIVEAFTSRTRWLWQCAAWSGDGAGTGGTMQGRRLSAASVLYQLVGYVLGDTCDENVILSTDWGGWNPAHPYPTKEDEMASAVILDPDSPAGATWHVMGLERKVIATPDDAQVLIFLGAKDAWTTATDADADARRIILRNTTDIDAHSPAAPAPVAAGGLTAAQVADELANRLRA